MAFETQSNSPIQSAKQRRKSRLMKRWPGSIATAVGVLIGLSGFMLVAVFPNPINKLIFLIGFAIFCYGILWQVGSLVYRILREDQ